MGKALDRETVQQIGRMLDQGVMCTVIARETGVALDTVYQINREGHRFLTGARRKATGPKKLKRCPGCGGNILGLACIHCREMERKEARRYVDA